MQIPPSICTIPYSCPIIVCVSSLLSLTHSASSSLNFPLRPLVSVKVLFNTFPLLLALKHNWKLSVAETGYLFIKNFFFLLSSWPHVLRALMVKCDHVGCILVNACRKSVECCSQSSTIKNFLCLTFQKPFPFFLATMKTTSEKP